MKFSFVHKSSIYIWMIGIVAALVSSFTVEFYESRRLHDQVEIQFHTKVNSLEQSMRSLSQLLYSTHHFLQNGNNPTQEQFEHESTACE
ncbi:hypothetical protein MHN01_03370 [Photobacterium sp. OFAV2-7]|nr:hypothetical protein [Photobacterium sp. OFAV2-7]